MKKRLWKNSYKGWKRGETLLEVIIALLVITIGSAAAASLVLSAMNANMFNKDSLIALNLAQEGIEYMRNVRDTNWMKFSANTQGCWNALPTDPVCTGLSSQLIPPNGVNNGYYLGDSLIMNTPELNLNNGDDPIYQLKYYDLDPLTNSDDLQRSPALDGKLDDYDFIGSNGPAGSSLVRGSKYYRSISISYFTVGPSAPWSLSPTPGSIFADLMTVTSKVQWKGANNIVHTVTLTSALSRYK